MTIFRFVFDAKMTRIQHITDAFMLKFSVEFSSTFMLQTLQHR